MNEKEKETHILELKKNISQDIKLLLDYATVLHFLIFIYLLL